LTRSVKSKEIRAKKSKTVARFRGNGIRSNLRPNKFLRWTRTLRRKRGVGIPNLANPSKV